MLRFINTATYNGGVLRLRARGGLPLRYARDLRPLAAIPFDAILASLHTPLRGTPRYALRLLYRIYELQPFSAIRAAIRAAASRLAGFAVPFPAMS